MLRSSPQSWSSLCSALMNTAEHCAALLMFGPCTKCLDDQLPILLGWAPSRTSLAIINTVKARSGTDTWMCCSIDSPLLRLQDPDKFCASVEAEQQALRDKLVAATSRLPDVAISTDTKLKISEVRPWYLRAVLDHALV